MVEKKLQKRKRVAMERSELNALPNLQFIPVNKNKHPIPKAWQTTATKYDLSKSDSVGLVCGMLSAKDGAGLEILDVDLKYDLTGRLWTELRCAIRDNHPGLLEKFVVASTRNHGNHLLFRCKKIEGNKHLAKRPTTNEEKVATYDREYKEKFNETQDEAISKDWATKQSENDKYRVLLETRGEGGYVMCYPSAGYQLIYGSYETIQEITEEERDNLFSCARSFNEVYEEYISEHHVAITRNVKGLSSCDDYDERGDVIGLLESHGWRVTGKKGNKTILLRPGATSSKTSGNFDHSKKWFTVFSSSTEFEVQKAYKPYSVFAILECKGDFREAARKLYDMNFGDREEDVKKQNRSKASVSKIKLDDEDYSFLVDPKDTIQYLNDARSGLLKIGESTNIITLDKHFLFKDFDLVMTNGHQGVGKSVWTWWLALLKSLLYGKIWLMYIAENNITSFVKRMIEFYWGKPITRQNDVEFRIAKSFVDKHFILIKNDQEFYSYVDLMKILVKCLKRYVFNDMLIDVYSSMRTELGYGQSKHDYNTEALTEMKIALRKNKVGMYINLHANTEALRKKDGDGYIVAPDESDTEGGGVFPNKADAFFTVHRIKNHPTSFDITEVHIRKIKEYETGGCPTVMNEPIKFKLVKNGCAFVEFINGTERDPIAEWHLAQRKNPNLPFVPPPPPPTESQHPWDDPNAPDPF